MSLDVKKIAHLARLAVDETDCEALNQDLNNALKLAEQINKVDTSKVEPLAHPYDEKQPLRQDVVTETDQRALFQSIAPETEDGLYIVPKVIEE